MIGLPGDGLVVRDHHDRQALFAVELFEQRENLAARFLIEIAGRLVGQKQLGLRR